MGTQARPPGGRAWEAPSTPPTAQSPTTPTGQPTASPQPPSQSTQNPAHTKALDELAVAKRKHDDAVKTRDAANLKKNEAVQKRDAAFGEWNTDQGSARKKQVYLLEKANVEAAERTALSADASEKKAKRELDIADRKAKQLDPSKKT